MLLEFSVSNFKSINRKCTLSMMAQGISDAPKDNITNIDRLKVLKSAVIYGANSSGKSNIVESMLRMRRNLLASVKLNNDDPLDYQPFLLSNEENKPSFFEVVFTIGVDKYRYGFELTSNEIVGEWLFASKLTSKKEKTLFVRTIDGIGVDSNNFEEGVGKIENTNDNRLFLSLCAQLGGVKSRDIIGWFQNQFNFISGIDSREYQNSSKFMFHDNLEGSDKARVFLKNLQLGFADIKTKLVEMSAISTNKLRYIEMESVHNIYDKNGLVVGTQNFSVEKNESEGTKKLIQLSGPIFDTLAKGTIIVIDELDAKMHPLISHYIINLFQNIETNPHNAQLIFTTHDTNLLSSNLFRRDQIWFTEKDNKEQTDLYNMMDIVLPDGSKPRNDANYEKNYVAGRYGAIPYIVNK